MNLCRKTAAVFLILMLLSVCSVSFADQLEAGTFYEEYGIWFDTKTGTITGAEEGLIRLELPDEIDGKEVLSIGEKAFYECETLKTAALPDSVTKIESQAFAGCQALEEITFSKNLKTIGDEAFLQCKNIKELSFPDDLERLGDSAFLGCSSLKIISLPQKINWIGEGAFSCCDQLTGIQVPEENKSFSSEDGVLFDSEQTKLIQYPAGIKDTSYSLPETVTEIANGGFAYNNYLKTVSLSTQLKIIGEYAFFDCDQLQQVFVPDTVVTIGKEAFAWCDQLMEVKLPEGLKTIEYGLFWYSKNIKQMNVPSSVTKISDYAFSRCEALESVALPEGVTSLGEESFAYCSQLREIVIPKTTVEIGKRAFVNGTALQSVTVRNGETAFSEQVFEGCGSLQFYTPEYSSAQQYALNRGDSWEKIVIVTLQGREISFDQPPVTRYDRTMVPVRAIFEAMGAQVFWEEETATVTAVKEDMTLSLQIGNQTMMKNEEMVILDVPALQINDRTMVPVRAVAEGFDCDIYWDEETQTVSIWEKEIVK